MKYLLLSAFVLVSCSTLPTSADRDARAAYLLRVKDLAGLYVTGYRSEFGGLLRQGALMKVGDPLVLAIHGEGFFRLETLNGFVYTRNGSFAVDPSARIVSREGSPLADLPALPGTFVWDSIQVNQDGRVTCQRVRGERELLGTIKLYQPAGDVVRVGATTYTGPFEEVPATEGQVLQGFRELSNVDQYETVAALYDYLLESRYASQQGAANRLKKLELIREYLTDRKQRMARLDAPVLFDDDYDPFIVNNLTVAD